MRDHSPAHPSFHPFLSVIAAPLQLMPSLQQADPPFYAAPPFPPPPKPPLLLVRFSRGRLLSRFRQHHLFDPFLLGTFLIGHRVGSLVCRQQHRRFVEHFQIMIQTRLDLLVIYRVAVEDLIAADDPAINFVQPHPSAELRGLSQTFSCWRTRRRV